MVGCMLSSNVVRNFDGRPRAVCKCAFSVTFSVKVMTHWKVFFRKYSFRKSLSKENFPVCHDLYIGCEPVATMQSIHWSPIIAVQTGALYSPPPPTSKRIDVIASVVDASRVGRRAFEMTPGQGAQRTAGGCHRHRARLQSASAGLQSLVDGRR